MTDYKKMAKDEWANLVDSDGVVDTEYLASLLQQVEDATITFVNEAVAGTAYERGQAEQKSKDTEIASGMKSPYRDAEGDAATRTAEAIAKAIKEQR